MDQDFHYYGTLFAARSAGWNNQHAVTIAKAANFTDMFTEKNYDGPWELIYRNRPITTNDPTRGRTAGQVDKLRYTFQANIADTGLNPASSTFAAFHFLPGNFEYAAYNIPTVESLHGFSVSRALGEHQIRPIASKFTSHVKWLTRPLSPLSRAVIQDTLKCFENVDYASNILSHAKGASELISSSNIARTDFLLNRFLLLLLGLRAHVIADTWAHQDFVGGSSQMNTYHDIRGSRQPNSWAVNIDDRSGAGQQTVVLGYKGNFGPLGKSETFNASPALDKIFRVGSHKPIHSDVGHGWMGHLPDYSWIQFQYLPTWAKGQDQELITRDNPAEYQKAFIELLSFFYMARQLFNNRAARKLSLDTTRAPIAEAVRAINGQINLNHGAIPRAQSAAYWLTIREFYQIMTTVPNSQVDVKRESPPDPNAMLGHPFYINRAAKKHYVDVDSDLYLFQIAADYHYHFVTKWLRNKQGLDITREGCWVKAPRGPLQNMVGFRFD